MVKILVRGPVGSNVFRVAFSDVVKSFIKQIGDYFHLDPAKIKLYTDHNFKNQVNESANILRAKIPDINKQPIVYIKYDGELPKVNTCSLTSYSNGADEIIGKEEERSPEIKNFQSMWGDRAIGASFFEHRKRKLPVIEEQPESSCFRIRVGREAVRRFGAIAFNEKYATHRIAFLFGRINKITGTITVHCSCEPEQNNYPDHVEVSPDFDISTPLLIADCFGMECVGIAISHLPNEKYPMSQYMVQLAAYYQNFFGEYFTTIVITPDPENEANLQMEAYQATDAAMKLDQGQYFAPSDDPHQCNFTIDILNQYYRKYCNYCNVNFLLTAVRIKETESKFPSHEFPSPSQYPTEVDFVAYMKSKESFPTWLQLFDFNFLVYIVNNGIISENDLPIAIDSIIRMKDIPSRIMSPITSYLRENSK